MSEPIKEAIEAEKLARIFHNIYERLAPDFGYETRKETREFDAATPNGRLMIAVCAEIQSTFIQSAIEKAREQWLVERRAEVASGAAQPQRSEMK